MNNITRNLHLLWRAERVLAQARLKLLTRKVVLGAIAGISGLFAWGMLNFAAFFALEPVTGKAWAACIVGAAGLALAAILVAIAQGLQPAPEEDMVVEVRNMALAEIEGEVDEVQQKLLQVRDDVQGVRENIAAFVSRPADILSPALIGPIVATIMKLLKAKKS